MSQRVESLERRIYIPEKAQKKPIEGVIFELSTHKPQIAEGLLSATAISIAYAKGDTNLLLATAAGSALLFYFNVTGAGREH
ncbi:hypothetical protein M1307_00700 [Patescibacteria group bacterium]|nr:hypothetical protein [Patescibacteria group bacterium]